MKKRFAENTELIIVTDFDEKLDEPIEETEYFAAGTEIEFEIIDRPQKFVSGKGLVDDDETINIQFPNGSMAFGVSEEWLV